MNIFLKIKEILNQLKNFSVPISMGFTVNNPMKKLEYLWLKTIAIPTSLKESLVMKKWTLRANLYSSNFCKKYDCQHLLPMSIIFGKRDFEEWKW
jgi:hypothetical protein